jgi:hypothetical protein
MSDEEDLLRDLELLRTQLELEQTKRLLAEERLAAAIPPGKCGNVFDPSPDLRYTCELLAGHRGWHQETCWPPGEPGVLRLTEPQIVAWNRVE